MLQKDVQRRQKVWKILSNLYLDMELQSSDFQWMARELRASGLPLAQIKDIDKYEVFPVLQANLFSPAGEWVGFDEEWLFKKCYKNYQKRKNPLYRMEINTYNCCCYSMRKKEWEALEKQWSS